MFRDLLGNDIMKIRLLRDTWYQHGESRAIEGEWQVNSWDSSQMRLRVLHHEDVKPSLFINKVVFDDNSIWSSND